MLHHGILVISAYSRSTCKSIFSKCQNLSLHIYTDDYYLAVQERSQTVQQWKCHYYRVMIKFQRNSMNLRIPGAASLTLLCGKMTWDLNIHQLDKCDSCLSHFTEKKRVRPKSAPQRFTNVLFIQLHQKVFILSNIWLRFIRHLLNEFLFCLISFHF